MSPSRFSSALFFALAGLVVGGRADTLTLSLNSYSNGNGLGGGSFTATPATPSLLSNAAYASTTKNLFGTQFSFETFCLEYGEHFNNLGTYTYTPGSAATEGSGGKILGPDGKYSDPISIGTAWLYYRFATGTLAGYDYANSVSRAASNNQLQLAFWFFEEETQVIGGSYATYGLSSANMFLNDAVAFFGGDLNAAKANANGAYGVQVLNLTSSNGTVNNQSQLYLSVPDNGATVLLVGLALVGLAGIRRKLSW